MTTGSRSFLFREGLLVLGFIVSWLVIPFELAFLHRVTLLGSLIVYLVDILYLTDLTKSFRRPFRKDGLMVTEPETISQHYRRTWFVPDLIASIPLDLLALVFLGPAAVSWVLGLRLLRLLRAFRVFRVFRSLGQLSWTNSAVLRILGLAVSMVVLVHGIACVWFLVAFVAGFPDDSWVFLQGIHDAGPGEQYRLSRVGTIGTMTTGGVGDSGSGV